MPTRPGRLSKGNTEAAHEQTPTADPENCCMTCAKVRVLDHLTLTQDAAGSEVEASLQKTDSPTAKHRARETTVGAGGEVPRAAHRIAKHKEFSPNKV